MTSSEVSAAPTALTLTQSNDADYQGNVFDQRYELVAVSNQCCKCELGSNTRAI